MGKGGDETTTSTSSGLPGYIEPYIKDLLAKAKTVTGETYQPYEGERIAEFSGDTNKAFDLIRQQVGRGLPEIDRAQTTASTLTGYTAGTIGPGSNVRTSAYRGLTPTTNTGTYRDVGKTRTGTFDPTTTLEADIGAYMDPYIGNVLDVTKDKAQRRFQEQQAGRDASAIAAGAFGGDRRFVADSMAERDLNEQLDSINATGLSNAYNSATGLFQQDEARRLSAYEGDETRRLTASENYADRVQRGFETDQGRALTARTADEDRQLRAYEGDQGRRLAADTGNADRGLASRIANEEARRLAGGLRLDAAGELAKFGGLEQDMAFRNAEALSGVGSKIQQREQAGLDQGYKDFLEQRNYPTEQLKLYSNILNGVGFQPQTTTTTTTPPPDFLSQLVGLFTTGAGIYGSLT